MVNIPKRSISPLETSQLSPAAESLGLGLGCSSFIKAGGKKIPLGGVSYSLVSVPEPGLMTVSHLRVWVWFSESRNLNCVDRCPLWCPEPDLCFWFQTHCSYLCYSLKILTRNNKRVGGNSVLLKNHFFTWASRIPRDRGGIVSFWVRGSF